MFDPKKEIENLNSLTRVLYEDIEKSITELNQCSDENFGYHARNYIRALASWIEGNIFLQKQILQKIEYQWHKEMSIEYQLYIFEKDFNINDKGECVSKKKHIGIKENLVAFFNIANMLYGSQKIDKTANEWASVMNFFKLRDGLMHPKSIGDLTLDKATLYEIDKGRVWLYNEFTKVTKALADKI